MNYFIKRDLNEYGPYSLADLQKYVASGNILLTDLCRSEGLADWVPVSQVIGNIPVPLAAPQPAAAAGTAYGGAPAGGAPAAVSQYPAPPNLHWGAVLAITLVTCTIFGWVWAFVQAAWVKKVEPNNRAILYYSAALAVHFGAIIVGLAYGISLGLNGAGAAGINMPMLSSVMVLVRFLIIGIIIAGNFNMRNSIDEHFNTAEPIGLSLSGVMTFFFGIFYFQYHFTRINEMKQRQMSGYSG